MRDQEGAWSCARNASTSAALYSPSLANSKLRTEIPVSPPTIFFALAWSASLSERNLPASCNILLSSVTSTDSSALAASLSKAGGILISCAHAEVSMAATIPIAIRIILLSLPWSVIDALDRGLRQPQLAACDPQRQHHLILGPFSLRLPLPLVLHSPHSQCHPSQRRGPAQTWPPEQIGRAHV